MLCLVMEELPPDKSKNGRPSAYSDKVADEIVAACRSGFTMEKAAELVGLEPKTVQNWVGKRREFGERIKKARREHELCLLKDIELAGAKSWQAKAWMAERVYNYAQPSARLQIAGEVQHGVSGNLVAMLAGIASRKKTETTEKRQIKNATILVDAKELPKQIENQKSNNNYCINFDNNVNNKQLVKHNLPKQRHKQMRRRKPRSESLAKYPTTTPPATPPSTA